MTFTPEYSYIYEGEKPRIYKEKGEEMKRTRKIIAILLTVLTLMSVISAATPVLAAEVTETAENTEATLENSETIEAEKAEQAVTNEPEILNEVVEWRTESAQNRPLSYMSYMIEL